MPDPLPEESRTYRATAPWHRVVRRLSALRPVSWGMALALPYLGPVVGVYTDWTPLSDRERLFPEDLDKTDPWQFKNVRVS